jgi:predicted ArsR family transcriptional regulator
MPIRKTDLSPVQRSISNFLRKYPGSTRPEISEALKLDEWTVRHALDDLEHMGALNVLLYKHYSTLIDEVL